MATGRQVVYNLQLNSNVLASLQAHESAARNLDSSMWQLQKTLAAFGVGLGAHYLKDFVQGAVEGAADYEVAMLRIKNASENATQGLKNQFFIRDEVSKFKIDLQDAADSYGSFLLKIKNAGLSSDVQRTLFDNLQTISKVSGLPQNELDATIRNISIMLGEGVLEARHLRGLSYVHPQIVPFLAKELGLKDDDLLHKDNEQEEATALQKLSRLISSGKLTKLGLPADIIVRAVQSYKEAVEGGLPEALKTITSETNDLHNAWLDFKNSVVMDLKPELIGFFHGLGDAVGWMKEHKAGLEAIGGVLFHVLKGYAEFKLLQLGINLTTSAYASIQGLFIRNTITQTSSTAALNTQMEILNANMRALILLQSEVAVGMGAITGAEQAALLSRVNQGATVAGTTARSSFGGNVAGTVIAVGIAYIAGEVLGSLVNAIHGRFGDEGYSFSIFDPITGNYKKAQRAGISQDVHENLQGYIDRNFNTRNKSFNKFYGGNIEAKLDPAGEDLFNYIKKIREEVDPKDNLGFDIMDVLVGHDKFGKVNPHQNKDLYDKLKGLGYNLPYLLDFDPSTSQASGAAGRKTPKIDLGKPEHIRGNSSNYITINIDDMIGMNNPKFTVSNMTDMKEIQNIVGVQLTRILTDVVNDSQLIGRQHH